MATYRDIIKKCFEMYLHRDQYAYWYGANGAYLSDSTMLYLTATDEGRAYFTRYDQDTLRRLMDWSRGKTGLDCSGFVAEVTGIRTYSLALWEQAECKTTPREGPEGSLLFTTFGGKGRHVGIDIGYGYFMHSRSEGHTLEIGRIEGYGWEGSGRFPGIDYSGAYELRR